MTRSRNYCFTYHLYENKEIFQTKIKGERFIILGDEIGKKTKKKHLQGFIQFETPITWSNCVKRLPEGTAHIKMIRGTVEENINYCSKEAIFIQRGIPSSQGKREDLISLQNDIENGKTNLELAREKTNTYERYWRYVNHYRSLLEKEKSDQAIQEFNINNVKLNPFQLSIMDSLNTQSEREVLWVHDPVGNTGKTYLSKVLIASNHAFRCTNGKSKDIAYAYNGEPIFIMDLSRSLEDHVNYDIIEQIKNGLIFSPKYESKHKIFKPPKVLILANFKPDLSKLSNDRWQKFSSPLAGEIIRGPANPNEIC